MTGFHMIACNPPYITPEEMDALDPSVRDWEPALALDGGEDAAADLLSSLVSRGVRVLECRVEAANLEDVFMNVTKGDVA